MDVAISALRAELAEWIDRARRGEDVVITDRGTPVVRLLAIDSATTLDRLTREGAISSPRRAARPVATGMTRARASKPVADLIEQQRR